MSSLTIFVLCYNRPAFVRETINSILAQSDKEFDLIVSDNSSNNDVQNLVREEFPQINYRRRLPSLQALEHFNRCIDEAQSELFCLFHDDDIMHSNFVEVVKKSLKAHPEAVACACNALIESFGKIEQRTSFRALGTTELITSPRDLARRYFARAQSGIAPFPSYVYRRRTVGEVRLPVEGGKYADVTWLLSLAMKASIVWITAPLMTYRMHGGNDGLTESLRDRLRFLGFIKKHINELGKDLLDDYRCSFIYKQLLKDKALLPARRKLASLFLRRYSLARYAQPGLYTALIKRALIKRVAE